MTTTSYFASTSDSAAPTRLKKVLPPPDLTVRKSPRRLMFKFHQLQIAGNEIDPGKIRPHDDVPQRTPKTSYRMAPKIVSPSSRSNSGWIPNIDVSEAWGSKSSARTDNL